MFSCAYLDSFSPVSCLGFPHLKRSPTNRSGLGIDGVCGGYISSFFLNCGAHLLRATGPKCRTECCGDYFGVSFRTSAPSCTFTSSLRVSEIVFVYISIVHGIKCIDGVLQLKAGFRMVDRNRSIVIGRALFG